MAGGENQAPLLEVDRLTIFFRGQAVVRDLSFALQNGEVLGLVGESGSGKSVSALAILRLLDGAARVEGSIRFLGVDLLKLAAEEMRHYRGKKIAMIFQEPMTALNPVMPIGKQIGEALETHQPELSRWQVRQGVIEALRAVSIHDPERRLADYPHQFSGGQRQRILIAMAVVNRPQLLIADEPTTALDVTVQAQILDLLKSLQLQFGLSMIFISHDLAVIGEIAGRIAVMRHGLLLETGNRSQIFFDPRHSYTRSLLGAVPSLETDRQSPLTTLAIAAEEAGGLVEETPGHWVRRNPQA